MEAQCLVFMWNVIRQIEAAVVEDKQISRWDGTLVSTFLLYTHIQNHQSTWKYLNRSNINIRVCVYACLLLIFSTNV